MMRSIFAVAMIAVVSSAGAQDLDTRHYIYIEASGAVEAPADHATVAITATSKAQTPGEAVAANTATTDALSSAFVALGIAKTDIETRNFAFEAVYLKAPGDDNYYRPSDPDRDTFDGYRVVNGMTITVRDISKVGELLSSVARLGAEISSLSFGNFSAPSHYERAQQEAAKNALTKATRYADALGVKLGSILSAREGSGYDPATMEFAPVDGVADPVVMPISVAPGDIVYSSKIAVKWEVLPR